MPTRQELLEAFEDLRVTDVSDGMDWMMHHDVGLVDREIRPLFRTRIYGIAKTVRYVPTNRKIPTMTPQEYDEFVREWYKNVCPYPFGESIQAGDVIVIDQSNLEVGLLGSANSMAFIAKGAVGLITNGGVRDTDELIRQKTPVWCRGTARTMVQGRLEFADMDVPVDLGGVKVRPGDVIVADGDGVIVVPQEIALDVAKWAHAEHERDKIARGRLYVQLGLPTDETVEPNPKWQNVS